MTSQCVQSHVNSSSTSRNSSVGGAIEQCEQVSLLSCSAHPSYDKSSILLQGCHSTNDGMNSNLSFVESGGILHSISRSGKHGMDTTILFDSGPNTSIEMQENHPQLHLGTSRQYWRDIILGVNDGIVSTFLLVAGVSGGGMASHDIFLTAVAGAIAGAVSMCAGEYIATKSQNEVLVGEIELEREHIRTANDSEMEELKALFTIIGIHESQLNLRNQLDAYYRNNPDALLKIMKALEFGIVDEEVRSPAAAGLVSGFVFAIGSIPSIAPFALSGKDPASEIVGAAILTTLSLLVVGGIKTWATRGRCLTSAAENLIIAGCGGILAYSVGLMFDSQV